jgi:hypothetical protein
VASDEGDSTFYIVNNQATMDSLDLNSSPTASAFEPGQFGVLGVGFPTEFAAALGIGEGDGPAAALNALVDMLTESEDDVSFDLGEPEVLALEDQRAALVTGSVSEGDVTNDATFVMVEVDGGFVLLLAFAAEGSMNEYDAVLRAIAASVEYTPPEDDSDF